MAHSPALGFPAAALAFALGLATGPISAQQPIPSEPRTSTAPTTDIELTAKYLNDTSMSDRFEIEAARIALDKSRNDEVRRFAREMIDEHQRMAADLQSAAGGRPTMAAPLSAEHAQNLQRLRQASATEFDRLYIDMQVLGHRVAIELHQDYARDGMRVPLKRAAHQAIAHIQEHLRHAQALQQQIAEVPWQAAPSDRS